MEILNKSRVNTHLLYIFLFLIIAAIYHLAVFNGKYPYVYLTSDAANIASMVAARENPDSFKNDEVLNDPNKFNFYKTIHIYVLPLLTNIFGDYGTAYHSLLSLHILMQCIGFYIFGLLLFNNSLYAFLLTFFTLLHFPTGIIDYWGIFQDPLPRNTMQAFLPYLMYVAYKYRNNQAYCPLVIFFAGLLMYVHPVSAPVWGVAIWMGFILFLPSDWSIKRKIIYMTSLGLIYAVAIFPFAFNYLFSHAHGTTIDYQTVYKIMQFKFFRDYLDIPYALYNFLFLNKGRMLSLILLALVNVLYLLKNNDHKKDILIFLMWGLGIAICSVIIPLSEQFIARKLNKIPFELDLIRGIRFIVPLSAILILLGIQKAGSENKYNLKYLTNLGLALAIFVANPNFKNTTNSIYANWRQTGFFQKTDDEVNYEATLNFLKTKIPKNSLILSFSLNSLAIRYYAIKPIFYYPKDGGILAYANHEELIKWYDRSNKLVNIFFNKNIDENNLSIKILKQFNKKLDENGLSKLIDFAQNHGVRYIIMAPENIPNNTNFDTMIIFKNKNHAVFALGERS